MLKIDEEKSMNLGFIALVVIVAAVVIVGVINSNGKLTPPSEESGNIGGEGYKTKGKGDLLELENINHKYFCKNNEKRGEFGVINLLDGKKFCYSFSEISADKDSINSFKEKMLNSDYLVVFPTVGLSYDSEKDYAKYNNALKNSIIPLNDLFNINLFNSENKNMFSNCNKDVIIEIIGPKRKSVCLSEKELYVYPNIHKILLNNNYEKNIGFKGNSPSHSSGNLMLDFNWKKWLKVARALYKTFTNGGNNPPSYSCCNQGSCGSHTHCSTDCICVPNDPP